MTRNIVAIVAVQAIIPTTTTVVAIVAVDTVNMTMEMKSDTLKEQMNLKVITPITKGLIHPQWTDTVPLPLALMVTLLPLL